MNTNINSQFQEDIRKLLILETKKILITKELSDRSNISSAQSFENNPNDSIYLKDIQRRINNLQDEVIALSSELNIVDEESHQVKVDNSSRCTEDSTNFNNDMDNMIVSEKEMNEILDQCQKEIKLISNPHKLDSLKSKTNPMYTLPSAFKYDIKMRDTKMKGMSMYDENPTESVVSSTTDTINNNSNISTSSVESTSKSSSPTGKKTASILQGSKERESELQSFIDTSPSLTHSINDLTEAIEQCTKDSLDGGIGCTPNDVGVDNCSGLVNGLVDGIEFCIVEADWSRLQETPSISSSSSSNSIADMSSVPMRSMRPSALLTPLLPPQRSWRYPHDLEDNSLVNNTKELQDQSFFFPSGVKVELVACAVAELRSKTSQYIRHVVPFTDGQGKPTYACVLTISQVYDSHEISLQGDNIVPNLVKINKQKQASTCIQKCFRQFLAYRKVQNWQMRRPTSYSMSGINSFTSGLNSPGDLQSGAGGGGGNSFRNSFFRGTISNGRMSDTSVHGAGTSSSGVNTPAKQSDSGSSNPSNTANRQSNNFTRRTFLSYFSRNNNNSTTSNISQASSAIQSNNNSSDVINSDIANEKDPIVSEIENQPSTTATDDVPSALLLEGDNSTDDKQVQEQQDNSLRSSTSSKHRFSLDKDSIAEYISKKTIVAQKAYCIISTSQQYTFIFKVLDSIAAAESVKIPSSSIVDVNNRSDQRNRFLELVETFLITHLVHKNTFSNPLHQISRSLITRSMKKQPTSTKTNNKLTNLTVAINNNTTKQQNLVRHIRVPGYISDFPISLDTLLSTKEWTCSVLFTHLNSQIVFKIINLLLMEKSLIIHGRNTGIVTTITMAVINLISPFSWEGIFVPLVPDNARELFGAPVPLIVGTTSPPRVNDVSADTAILFLNDDNVVTSPIITPSTAMEGTDKPKDAKGGSNIEMKFVAWFVRLPEVSADMPFELEICRRIDYTSTLLCNYCLDKIEFKDQELESRNNSRVGSPIISPSTSEHKRVGIARTFSSRNKSPFANCRIANTIDSLLMSDVPLKILEQVRILIASIQRYNYGFCGCVLDEPGTWKKFLKHSNRTGEDEFYPEYFMEPLRNHLEFQDAIVHTQLFVSFMDKLHKEHRGMDVYRL